MEQEETPGNKGQADLSQTTIVAENQPDGCEQTEEPADLEKIISDSRSKIDVFLESSPDHIDSLMYHACALQKRHDQSPSRNDLEDALSMAKEAIDTMPERHPSRPRWLNNYAGILQSHYEYTGNNNSLDEAIIYGEKAVEETPDGSPELVAWLNHLGGYLAFRYDKHGNFEDLERAIENVELAVGMWEPEDSRSLFAACLINLSTMMQRQYKYTEDYKDLECAMDHLKVARRGFPKGTPHYSTVCHELSNVHKMQFLKTAAVKHIDSAVSMAQEAVEQTSEGSSAFPVRILTLSSSLGLRFQRTGNRGDLESSVHEMERALKTLPTGHRLRTTLLNNLAASLTRRFEQFGSSEDIDSAVSRAHEAVAESQGDGPGRVDFLLNLAKALIRRGERKGSNEDIKVAVSTMREALGLTPKADSKRATVLRTYATALAQQYKQTHDMESLKAAISLAKTAVIDHAHNDSHRAGTLNNLSSYMLMAGQKGGIPIAKQAVALMNEQDVRRGRMLINLGRCLAAEGQWKEAAKTYSNILLNEALGPLERVASARLAIQVTYNLLKDADKANQLAKTALNVLPIACSRDLNRTDQQYAVALASRLAADCCSISLRIGNIEEALERIEYGRGLVLTNLINIRNDMSELAKREPQLAQEYRRLTKEAFRNIDSDLPGALKSELANERRIALAALKDCEHRIRQVVGFRNFSLPRSAQEMIQSSREEPIVIVNVTDIGSDAIILTKSEISSVELPGMDSERPQMVMNAISSHRAVETEDWDRGIVVPNQDKIGNKALTWLWRKCVHPILQHLHLDAVAVAPQTLPRIWWIGSGAASSLPFHAAGDYADTTATNFRTSLDLTIPSYTPTITALEYSRSRASGRVALDDYKPSVLTVTMPTTPQHPPLRGVKQEQQAIQAAVTPHWGFRPLERPTATEVLQGVRTTDIAHFACHGFSDPSDPSDSHLLLQKAFGTAVDRLTVSSLLDVIGGSRAWIAYLSACSTAQIRAQKLADEGIHLASAFQIAGFAHVIGSLWSADDEICVEVALHFYKSLLPLVDNTKDPNRAVAEALRCAVLEVRSRHLETPSIWAPFVHFGA